MRMRIIVLLFGALLAGPLVFAAPRFPPPDFESGYTQPVLTFQEYRTGFYQYADTIVFVIALFLAAWLLHARRSRIGIFWLGIFSLLYLGFYKMGCICAIGAIQNVTLAMIDPLYTISIPVLIVFFLPLFLALLFGRVFCGGVCPLGAIQDLFLFKPLQVPRWLEGPIGLLRFFYLGLAVFFVVRYQRFVICEYDPFVSFFRFDGPAWRFLLGGAFLLTGLFIARPYCRYLCPYGGLLSLLSRWARTGVRITPTECTNCTLCDAACPFGAIHRPEETVPRSKRLRVICGLLCLAILPALAALGWWTTGKTQSGMMLGSWFGIVMVIPLARLTFATRRPEYEPDQGECLSCGRCYSACPYERQRWEKGAAHE